jgi:glycosyltransferase involved in cell wall biosynthesis
MKPQREQRKNLKVVHLNASSAGGAFVAAQRLSCALDLLPEVDSTHWVFEGGEGDFFLWADDWLKKKWAFALHALEKLDFLRFEREKAVRFAFSHGKTGVNVSSWEAIADADVIHLHWVNKGFIGLNGLEALLKLNKRVVWTCHDMWPFTGGCYHPRGCDYFQAGCGNCHYLKSPADGDLSRRVFSAKQRMYQSHGGHLQFVTPSQWLKDQALKSGALTTNLRHGIQVIPNPIDTDYFYPARIDISGIEGIAKEGIAKEGIVIEGIANQGLGNDVGQGESVRGHIDRDDKAVSKTFTLMFAAANLGNAAKGFAEFRWVCNELVARGFSQVEALIVGENRIGDLGLKCKYRELGFIKDAEQMREAYWQSDVYVTTSHEENLPTTIMESLSCGVPVAAFAVGGIPEMLVASGEHQTGFLVPKLGVRWGTTDIFMEQMVDELSNYIVSPESEVNHIKQNCREFALQNYSANQIALAYEQVYRA